MEEHFLSMHEAVGSIPSTIQRTPKCRDAGPPFTRETRKLSLREVMISAESQGKRGTEPGLVVAMPPSEPAGESGEQPPGPCSPFPALLERSHGLCVHVGTCVAG